MRIVFKTSYDADIRLFENGVKAARYIALLLVAIAIPFLFGDYWVGEFTLMLIWAIAGMGLMLLVGHTGQASLGHAAFMAVGAYVNVILMSRFGLPFLVTLPVAAIAAGITGWLIALPTTKLHGIYLAIATLAISVLADDIIVILDPWTGGVGGISAPTIEIFGWQFNRYTNVPELYWLVLLITVIILLGYKNLLRSPLGRSFAAVRDSEISAQAMGVNVARTRALSFALSCGITGIAGALMAHFLSYFNNEAFTILISINLLLMIVIGGLGFIQGAFLGAAVVVFLPTLISLVRDNVINMKNAWAGSEGAISSLLEALAGFVQIPGIEAGVLGAILILLILFEPMGLYGRWLKIRTYLELFPFYRRDMFKRQKSYLKTERMR